MQPQAYILRIEVIEGGKNKLIMLARYNKMVMFFAGLVMSCVTMVAQWMKVIGGFDDDYFNDIFVYDTVVIVGGGTESWGNGQLDWWVVQLGDLSGGVVWAKTIGNASRDELFGVSVSSEGRMVLSGEVSSVSTSARNDVQIAVMDLSGNVNSVYRLPHVYSRDVWHVYTDTFMDSLFVVWGDIRGRSGWGWNAWDGYLIRLNSSGGFVSHGVYGGFFNEGIHDLEFTSDYSQLWLLSWGIGYGFGSSDFILTRMDTSGGIVFQFVYGTLAQEVPWKIIRDGDRLFLIGWTASGTNGGADILVVVTDTMGNLGGAYSVGTAADEYAYDAVFIDGRIYIAGFTNYRGDEDGLIVAIDTSMNVVWANVYGGSGNDRLLSVAYRDRFIYAAGWTTSWSAQAMDGLVIKVDTTGILACDMFPVPVNVSYYPILIGYVFLGYKSPPNQIIPGANDQLVTVVDNYSCVALSLMEVSLEAVPLVPDAGYVEVSYALVLPEGASKVILSRYVENFEDGRVLLFASEVLPGVYENVLIDSLKGVVSEMPVRVVYRLDVMTESGLVSRQKEVILNRQGFNRFLSVFTGGREVMVPAPPFEGPYFVRLIDVTGRVVVELFVAGDYLHVPVDLSDGVYYMLFSSTLRRGEWWGVRLMVTSDWEYVQVSGFGDW